MALPGVLPGVRMRPSVSLLLFSIFIADGGRFQRISLFGWPGTAIPCGRAYGEWAWVGRE